MTTRRSAMALFAVAESLEAQAAQGLHANAAPLLSRADLLLWTLGLGLVIIFILISAWILRRLNRFSLYPVNRLKILAGISVGTRERVVLLQVGEKRLLLGVAPGRVTMLDVLQPEEFGIAEKTDPAGSGEGFAERIRQAMKGS
jgi:flagellar protein FliO/FliZ